MMIPSISLIIVLGADLRPARHAVDLLIRSLRLSVVEEIVMIHTEQAGHLHDLLSTPELVKVHRIEVTMLCEPDVGDFSHYGVLQKLICQRLRADSRVHLCVVTDESSVPVHALLVGARFLRAEDGMWLLDSGVQSADRHWRLHSLPIRPVEPMHLLGHERRCEFLTRGLSVRERMIVQHLVKGRLSNREIGVRMGISERRVEKILSENIYPRLRRFLGREQVNRQDLVAEFAVLFDSGWA